MDVLLSASALLLLWPLMLATAAAVALESGRPVLFRQVRVGQGGRPFVMYKFRSMTKDAEARGPHFTDRGDPRITRVGGVIRRTNLDELPQLLNVLKGDMSLVGPRPDLPAQQSMYSDQDWSMRCSVRPGITGLAQALLRSEATLEQRIALDLQYVREAGCWLDLKIMILTFGVLAGRRTN
jgi:lipopolysaccharide/colanic/teichoic acid biosynthesis glycosyltransferase